MFGGRQASDAKEGHAGAAELAHAKVYFTRGRVPNRGLLHAS